MLKIYFLNVGHGDCIIVDFCDDNRVAIIDINRSKDMDSESYNEIIQESLNYLGEDFRKGYNLNMYSEKEVIIRASYNIELQDPIACLQSKNMNSIFRFISTHPHMDHLSGLYTLNQKFSIGNIWILNNDFTQNDEKLTDSQKDDWNFYTSLRDCKESKKDGITIVRPLEKVTGDFWTQDGITILAPNSQLLTLAKDKNSQNIMSYVLLIEYGSCKIVLGGDAEEDTWKYLTESYENDLKDITILKASHHGRDSGYYQPAVELMNPVYTIVSVGKKPPTDAYQKYKQYSDHVFSTRWKGNIIFECNRDGTVIPDLQYDR